MNSADIIKYIQMLNNRHISLFKAGLIDEFINITINNLDKLIEDLKCILEYMDIWVSRLYLYNDEIELKEYYNNLKINIKNLLKSIDNI